MLITVTKSGVEVYKQLLEDSKTLNATIAFLMQQPSGTEVKTVVTNNGHDLAFNSSSFDVEPLVRKVNGIISRETGPRKPKE